MTVANRVERAERVEDGADLAVVELIDGCRLVAVVTTAEWVESAGKWYGVDVAAGTAWWMWDVRADGTCESFQRDH